VKTIKENKAAVKAVRKRKKYGIDHWEMVTMILPGFIYAFFYDYLPLFGLVLPFKDYRYNLGIFGSEWCGIDNFKFLFASNTLPMLLKNTLIYNFIFIFLNITCAVFVALCLNTVRKTKALKAYQVMALMPNFVSWVVISYIVYALLAPDTGIVNNILIKMGRERISFYSEPKYWPGILMFFNTWKHIGYNGLIYYGTILGIDPVLFEAAEIDGCSEIKKTRYIILPHLKSVIIIITLLGLGGILGSDYGLFYYLPRNTGMLYPTTDVLTTYVNRAIREGGSLNNASAVSFFTSTVGLFLVVTTNLIVKKIDPKSSLF